MTYTEDQMTALGGKLWEKNGKRRVYFNNWPSLINLEISRYRSGNISYASLDGEKISNARAYRLLLIKVYWENGDLFAAYGRDDDMDDVLERLQASIDAKFAEKDTADESAPAGS